jgi:hypothetical protein
MIVKNKLTSLNTLQMDQNKTMVPHTPHHYHLETKICTISTKSSLMKPLHPTNLLPLMTSIKLLTQLEAIRQLEIIELNRETNFVNDIREQKEDRKQRDDLVMMTNLNIQQKQQRIQ